LWEDNLHVRITGEAPQAHNHAERGGDCMIYIGIDIGKYHHEALALDRDGQILSKPIRFANSKTGFDRFNAYLKQFTVSGELSSSCGVKLACEATGHYWMNLYHFLKEEGLLVIVVNPLQTQAQRKAHIRRTKTDTRDALMVAKLLRLGELHVSYVPERQIFYLRELTRFRCGLADTVGDLKRQIIAVLDKVFPEYHTLFSDTFIKTAQAILQRNYLPSELAEINLAELTALLKQYSRGYFKKTKAQELIDSAKDSVGLSFLEDVAKIKLSLILPQLQLTQESLAKVDVQIARIFRQGNYCRHLLTIPGISEVLAASILAELGEVRRFNTLNQVVAFAGIDPSTFQSGQFKGSISNISKRGSPYLRRAVYLATIAAVRKDPELAQYFAKKQAQGKHYTMAAMATARKLLARIFVVLKENRPYKIRP